MRVHATWCHIETAQTNPKQSETILATLIILKMHAPFYANLISGQSEKFHVNAKRKVKYCKFETDLKS